MGDQPANVRMYPPFSQFWGQRNPYLPEPSKFTGPPKVIYGAACNRNGFEVFDQHLVGQKAYDRYFVQGVLHAHFICLEHLWFENPRE